MRECLDEGILQSYFDGELSGDQMESATSHLASCSVCSAMARELEGEINLVSTALAHEFDGAVPTERLRQRIDAAVAGAQLASRARSKAHSSSVRNLLQSLSALFAFTPQRAFGYAGLILVLGFAAVLGIIQWRHNPTTGPDYVATAPVTKTGPAREEGRQEPSPIVPPVTVAINSPKANPDSVPTRNPSFKSRMKYSVAKNRTESKVELLPGERSYLKTIAALDSTIKSTSNRPMRPALQAEYERNLALVDRALAATRNAAKKNPNDPDAAEFMFNAYQNKVNLLNTVADARSFNRHD